VSADMATLNSNVLALITLRVNGRKMQDHAKRVRYSESMLYELNKDSVVA